MTNVGQKKNYARGGQLVTQKVWCLSVDITVVSVDITFARFPPVSHFGPIMPTTLGKTTPPGRISPDQAKEQSDAARRRAQKTQSMRRKRAELTPSNKDLAKAQDTQSKRRKRAELSPEDKDQANAERRVKRRYKLAWPRTAFFLASICHAITDPPVTKIRLWASFGV